MIGQRVSEYQADRLAEDYSYALEQYNQVLADQYGPDDYYGGGDPYDPYNYYNGGGYNGFADDLGYYP